jgi:hypothetical protein
MGFSLLRLWQASELRVRAIAQLDELLGVIDARCAAALFFLGDGFTQPAGEALKTFLAVEVPDGPRVAAEVGEAR